MSESTQVPAVTAARIHRQTMTGFIFGEYARVSRGGTLRGPMAVADSVGA